MQKIESLEGAHIAIVALGNSQVDFAIGKEKFLIRNDLEKFSDPDYIRIYGREGQWVNRRLGYLSDGIFMSQEEINNHSDYLKMQIKKNFF